MTAKIEDLGSNKVRMEIQVPPERFQEALETAYRKNRGAYKIPGFRTGKAPRAVIESRFGNDVFFQEAYELVLTPAYIDACRDLGLVVVAGPMNLQVKEASPQTGVCFTVDVVKRPEVKLANWEGLHVTRVHETVTDDMVDAELGLLAEENAAWESMDEAAQEGNTVVIDYAGFLDGVPFEGGTAKQQSLILGSGGYIPGFENQIVGMKPGEQRTIKVRFPARYREERLAGKDVDFVIDMHDVRRKVLPELDDEFAEDVSELDTIAGLRDLLRSKLQESLDTAMEGAVEDELMAQIVEGSEVDIPDSMIFSKFSENMRDLERNLDRQGASMEMFLKDNDITREQLAEQMAAKAARDVKVGLVLEALVDEMHVDVTEEDRKQRVAEIAKVQNADPEELLSKIGEAQWTGIDNAILLDKILKNIKASAIIEDVQADSIVDETDVQEAQADPAADQTDAQEAQEAPAPEEQTGDA